MTVLSKNWPVIGIAVVMWLAVVILRTPAVGFDWQRVVAILISTTALITLGVYVERIRSEREREKEKRDKR